jgi:hypothetical protein
LILPKWARSSAWIERWPSEPEAPGSNPGGPALSLKKVLKGACKQSLNEMMDLKIISYSVSIAVSLIISFYFIFGYSKLKSTTFITGFAAFLLIALGLSLNFYNLSFIGYLFEAAGFFLSSLSHAKTVRRYLVLGIVPDAIGQTLAFFFSLYAGLETVLFYSRSGKKINLITGLGFMLISVSIFLQLIIYLIPNDVQLIVQLVGYSLLISALVR